MLVPGYNLKYLLIKLIQNFHTNHPIPWDLKKDVFWLHGKIPEGQNHFTISKIHNEAKSNLYFIYIFLKPFFP